MSISSSLLELSDAISSDSKEMDVDIVDVPLQANLENIYFREAAINIPVHEQVQFTPPCCANPFDEITVDEINREADLVADARMREEEEEEEMALYLKQEFPDSDFPESDFVDSDFVDSDFSDENTAISQKNIPVRPQYPYNFSGVDQEYPVEDEFVSPPEIHNPVPVSPEYSSADEDASRYVVNYELYTRPLTMPEPNTSAYPTELFCDDFSDDDEEE